MFSSHLYIYFRMQWIAINVLKDFLVVDNEWMRALKKNGFFG
jgi:hypothetical protein